jgi:peptidoglycan/LPS O-acetylase OafA/YrhL
VNGGYSVMLFFVVSGFLMSFVLDTKYNREGGTTVFYKARVTRIYPLWWAVWLFAAITLGFNGADLTVLDFLASLFLIGSDLMLSFWTYPESHSVLFPIGLGLGWSLGTESTFYLLAPFLLRTNVVCIGTLTVSGLVREIVNINFPLASRALDEPVHDVVHT